MKIGCDVCGRAEAAVLCCADEAALCRRCDAAVHSANRLAGRHSRVALLPSTGGGPSPANLAVDGSASGSPPTCDICQEKTGYFFCLEDRALLCRPCDVAVHAAGAHVASHRRFLITGVRVGDVVGHHVGDVVGHHVGGGMDAEAGVVVSPSTSSSSGNPMTMMPDKVRPSSPVSAAAREGLDGDQWPWSEFLADDEVATEGMEMRCPAGLSEPGSSSLTG